MPATAAASVEIAAQPAFGHFSDKRSAFEGETAMRQREEVARDNDK
jgi:hypothetical protein